MRLFIAIEVPDDIKNEVVALEEERLANFYRAKWIEKENIHLTLKFLGEVEERRLEDVKKIVSEISKNNAKFDLNLKNLGGFPNLKRPRVLWIGVEEGKENIVYLMEQLETAFARFGIEPEKRKKTPHITMGRVKELIQRYGGKEQKEINKLTYESRVFKANSILLFKSVLTPKGAVHTVVEQYALQ